jgi:urease accessory protein
MSQISGGATILPNNSGIITRILGNSSGDIRTAIYEVLRIVRRLILDASFSGIRKG